jgi:hypothetical protein
MAEFSFKYHLKAQDLSQLFIRCDNMGFLAPRPTPKLEDHLSSGAYDSIIITKLRAD